MSAAVWTRDVPVARGTFLGRQLRADIDFEDIGTTEPSASAKALLDEILSDFPAIVRRAELALAEYERGARRDHTAHIINPRIWICEGASDPRAWTLIVERDDWPDFGWHIEFSGSNIVDLWAAD